jgi:hypothetical protein
MKHVKTELKEYCWKLRMSWTFFSSIWCNLETVVSWMQKVRNAAQYENSSVRKWKKSETCDMSNIFSFIFLRYNHLVTWHWLIISLENLMPSESIFRLPAVKSKICKCFTPRRTNVQWIVNLMTLKTHSDCRNPNSSPNLSVGSTS